MNKAGEYTTYQHAVFNVPELADWEAYLTPGGFARFRPTKGNVPNAFHRFMQRLCFGIRWYRVK